MQLVQVKVQACILGAFRNRCKFTAFSGLIASFSPRLSFEMLSRCVRATSSKLFRFSTKGVTAPNQYRAVSSDPADYFHYTRAVFGTLSQSFVTESLRHDEPEKPIDLQKAIRDHEVYVREVTKLVPNTVQITADDRFPDLVFVEDPAVVLDGKALITKMRPASRAGEVELIRPVLEGMGLDILEIDDPEATIDGGDVMFTGREFLVGVSKRTNAVSNRWRTEPESKSKAVSGQSRGIVNK